MARPNVLLVVMDTARAKSVLPSENPGVMPNLEAFADEGTVLSDAITTAPWTLPSHASMFTGQYTSDHGTNAGSVFFDPEVTPLPEALRRAGYQTMAVSNNTWISPEFGFDAGFDQFYRGWELVSGGVDLSGVVRENRTRAQQARAILGDLTLRNWPATLLNTAYSRLFHRRTDYGARLTNFRVKRLLSRSWDRSKPFFLFLNYLEPHLTYDPPEPYRYDHLPADISETEADAVEQDQWEYICGNLSLTDDDFRALEALYEGELSYLDYRLGRLFEFLEGEKLLDETLVIVTGDHGENIGDHGLMDHQYCLYDTLLRVPLVLRYPDRVPRGLVTDDPVELRDLYPSVLECCDVPVPDTGGVSSFSLFESGVLDESAEGGREAVFAEYVVPQPSVDQLRARTENPEMLANLDTLDRSLRCVRTREWKYVRGSDGSAELFDLEEDPEETADVAADYPELVDEFERRLDDAFGPLRVETTDGIDDIDTGTRDRLEELGYI